MTLTDELTAFGIKPRRLASIPPNRPTIPWAVWLFEQQDREAIRKYREEQEQAEAKRKIFAGGKKRAGK